MLLSSARAAGTFTAFGKNYYLSNTLAFGGRQEEVSQLAKAKWFSGVVPKVPHYFRKSEPFHEGLGNQQVHTSKLDRLVKRNFDYDIAVCTR